MILPRPLHAIPEICVHVLGVTRPGYDGAVMIDFASITKLNCRAVSFGSGSVYFEVSSRNMPGPPASSMRRTHLTFAFPSQPGSRSLAGYPFAGRNGSPLNA